MAKSEALPSGGVPTEPPPPYTVEAKSVDPAYRRILEYMQDPTHRVILASASPRRRDLLAQIGLHSIEILPSTKPEDLPKDQLQPEQYVAATAEQKADDVYRSAILKAREGGDGQGRSRQDPDLVIAADTVIVTRGGMVLEKPRSADEHKRMLCHLRNTRTHRVLTAVCCVAPKLDPTPPGYEIAKHIEETEVTFRNVSDDVIDAYIRTGEGSDKAGGYAIQGIAREMLIEKPEEVVDNVVGLPVDHCLRLCNEVVFTQPEEETQWWLDAWWSWRWSWRLPRW